MNESSSNLEARILSAAEAVLQRNGSIGPLELFIELRWLQPVHFEGRYRIKCFDFRKLRTMGVSLIDELMAFESIHP